MSDRPIVLRGVAIPAGTVDRQGDMVTAEALENARASFEKLKGTTVHHSFDLTRPVGVVRDVELRKDGLYVVAEIMQPFPPDEEFSIRPAIRVTKFHKEGEVQVVDEVELLSLSLVPKADAP